MSVRRLHPEQPERFEFTPENVAWAREQIAKFPEGRQAGAVLALLWRAQEQHGGWLCEPAIRYVAEFLDMPYIRVYEVATFYTMFNLSPVGKYYVQVCTTTPCWLKGSDEVVAACKKYISEKPDMVTDDGLWSWTEVECMAACVNAPMIQINKDYYEDLDGQRMTAILEALKRGETPEPGPQIDRHKSAPVGGPTTLKGEPPYHAVGAKVPAGSGDE